MKTFNIEFTKEELDLINLRLPDVDEFHSQEMKDIVESIVYKISRALHPEFYE